ncbi:MAG: hypothetical protein JNN25_03995 [Candidatus Kapabacteria bacterium]|nr:hypothetical protein [Candidatus Kapabacteria bacterium]
MFRSMPKMLQSSFNACCQEEYFALFLLDAYVQMRAFSVLVRANSVLVSVATRQNCIFGGMLPKLMANGSQTVVVTVVFAVIPP